MILSKVRFYYSVDCLAPHFEILSVVDGHSYASLKHIYTFQYTRQTQNCLLAVGYTMDTMYFAWLPAAVEVDPSVELPQFTLIDEVLYDCSQNYTAGEERLCLGVSHD